MRSVSHQRSVTRPVASKLTVRRPLRIYTKARRSATVTERGGCGLRVHAQQPPAYAAQQPTQQIREQLALTVRPQPFVLSRSQLANKQVVSRTTGVILGVVDDLIANVNTCKVEAISLSKTKDALPGEEQQQIGLMSLKQISDVLLVHDERALLRQQLTVGMGCIQLIGKAVKTADGKFVGKLSIDSNHCVHALSYTSCAARDASCELLTILCLLHSCLPGHDCRSCLPCRIEPCSLAAQLGSC